jgi:NAD(P)-dependent dehydrogenase (short-subunit alcohol dehydrogenase family)
MIDDEESAVAIVTGAGQGLGRGIALRLAKGGARVVACDKNPEALAETLLLAGRGLLMRAMTLDVTHPNGPRDAVRFTLDSFGSIDWLVNNAGVGSAKGILETDDAAWDRYSDVNLRSVFRMSREVLPQLKAGRGSIVNMASVFGVLGAPGAAPYCATKAGVIGLTRQLACDFGPKGIRVNAVAPGIVATPATAAMLDPGNKRFKSLILDTIPYTRIGRPEDIGNAVYFLCSDQASYINGHVLCVDGGWTATGYLAE